MGHSSDVTLRSDDTRFAHVEGLKHSQPSSDCIAFDSLVVIEQLDEDLAQFKVHTRGGRYRKSTRGYM